MPCNRAESRGEAQSLLPIPILEKGLIKEEKDQDMVRNVEQIEVKEKKKRTAKDLKRLGLEKVRAKNRKGWNFTV